MIKGSWDSVDDARPQGHGDHSGAVTGAELAGDTGEVALDGQGGQAHRDADRLVRLALRHQSQHLDLTAGELAVAARVARGTRGTAVQPRGGGADGGGTGSGGEPEVGAGAGDDVPLHSAGQRV